MRPKKTRWIQCEPGERCFRPQCVQEKNLGGVSVTLDEFEALRLCDYEQLDQKKAAVKMRVHRSTVSRILTTARKKVADALVNIKAIRIEGGCCNVQSKRK